MRLAVISTLFLLSASMSALASTSNEETVAAAKVTLGQALYKSALLTGAMPEEGKADPAKMGQKMGAEMSERINNVVIGGLNQGANCDDITTNIQKSFEIMQRDAVNQFSSSSAIKKALDNVPLSAAQYAAAECQNLTSQ